MSKSKTASWNELVEHKARLRRCIKQMVQFIGNPEGREFWGDTWAEGAKALLKETQPR